MKIAIDASPAAKHLRTGIEEYSYQIIKELRSALKDHDVVLFVRRGTAVNIDFRLPERWRVKELWSPILWTYGRLSLAMFFGRFDRLFVPGHIVPPIHPEGTVTVVHGLEYEMTPEAFTRSESHRMRFGVKKSCKWARHIICVSNNTKADVMRLYEVPLNKIRVIYEGVNAPIKMDASIAHAALAKFDLARGSYLFFVGRIESRKNIIGILKAFELLKGHFEIPHKLVLAGKEGNGWQEILNTINTHPNKEDIIVTGFVSTEEKWALLDGASVFLFPTLYEGFGLPVLEAQQIGVPVVTSGTSSLQEIAQAPGAEQSAMLVNPENPTEIAEATQVLLTDQKERDGIIAKGTHNAVRFSWEKAAKLTAKVILAGQR